jgi:hypothetical protein
LRFLGSAGGVGAISATVFGVTGFLAPAAAALTVACFFGITGEFAATDLLDIAAAMVAAGFLGTAVGLLAAALIADGFLTGATALVVAGLPTAGLVTGATAFVVFALAAGFLAAPVLGLVAPESAEAFLLFRGFVTAGATLAATAFLAVTAGFLAADALTMAAGFFTAAAGFFRTAAFTLTGVATDALDSVFFAAAGFLTTADFDSATLFVTLFTLLTSATLAEEALVAAGLEAVSFAAGLLLVLDSVMANSRGQDGRF